MQFEITFQGRRKGALGTFRTFTEVRKGATVEEAVLALYDQFDHVYVYAPARGGYYLRDDGRVCLAATTYWSREEGGTWQSWCAESVRFSPGSTPAEVLPKVLTCLACRIAKEDHDAEMERHAATIVR